MPTLVRYFDPQPHAAELPAQFPSPFGHDVHPLARRAAEELERELRNGHIAGSDELACTGGGKMFGVLVIRDGEGRIGYLRAFSGMLDDRWELDGFAPPLFDRRARDAFWPEGEAELAAMDGHIRRRRDSAELASLRTRLAEMDARHAAERAALTGAHRQRRQRRQAARASAADMDQAQERALLEELAEESRADKRERKRQRALLDAEREVVAVQLSFIEQELARLTRARLQRSNELLQRIQDTYLVANAAGATLSLRGIFAPDTPPGGAGDCAAPKLLGSAYRRGLQPIAMAELWWGSPPLTGGRQQGCFYPACRRKCGPLLTFMMEGLDSEQAPVFGAAPADDEQPSVLYEDDWLLAVNKPPGLLSVPGRDRELGDSVLSRLRARYPLATGPLLVHRLDLDTSGLLLAAKTADAHAHLQRQFEARHIEKRYVAWLDGIVASDEGSVNLPIRVDVDDRPRQIYDPVHGRPATTHWRLLQRTRRHSKVALYPRTGRTHQLRVHAAHPLGIGAAIIGDRLYGRPGPRLLLHAEMLCFEHPFTGQSVRLECPAPF